MIKTIEKKNWAKLLLLLCIFIIPNVSFAETIDLIYADPIPDNDFKSKNSTCIVQDSKGFIWIGTNDGLYCLRGENLARYLSGGTDSTTLYDNRIQDLFIDNSGTLWIISVGGLCSYNPCLDNFNRILSSFELDEDVFRQISAIKQDQKNNIYISAANSIYQIDKEPNTPQLVFHNPDFGITDFLFDENNNIWISSNNGGLMYFNISERTSKRFLSNATDNKSLGDNNITDIVLVDNSKLWIATYGGGVNLLDTKNQEIKRYTTGDNYSDFIIFIYADLNNNIWICDLKGLRRYDNESDTFVRIHSVNAAKDLVEELPSKILQDKQGNYWTINSPGGVGLRYQSKGISIYDKNPEKFWHTISNNIVKIAFNDDDVCWVGNGNDGIDVFDFKNKRHHVYHSNLNDPGSLGRGAVCCLYNDSQNRMWVGTNLGGLQCYDPVNDKFITYINDPQDSLSISNNDIRGIQEDADGNFWIITHGKGIDYFNYKEQKFYNYNFAENGLSNDWSFQLLLDSDENLWVATPSGVSVLKKGAKKFTSYYHVPEYSHTIPSDYINCLFEDSKKRIWIGTFSGLCRYNPESDNFHRVDPGFPAQNICSVEEDRNGNLWISSVSGITGFNPDTEQLITNLDEADGLPPGIFKPGCSAKNTNNVLFFGGDNGIAGFDPDKLNLNTEVSDVFISGFYLHNKKVEKFGTDEILPKSPFCTDQIELKHKQNSIGFEYASTNYLDYAKNKFKYKLEGLDEDWIETDHTHVNYNYLAQGKYVFRVIAANNNGVWNKNEASIKVVISPPWWLTWWFISSCMVLLVFLIIVIFRYRVAKLTAEKHKLEGLVQNRTKVLKDKNRILELQKEKLHQRNSLLKQQKKQIETQTNKITEVAENLSQLNIELTTANVTKDKLFSIIAHDLINPFNAILGFSDVLIEGHQNMDEENRMELIKHIHDSSHNAFDLLNSLLHWARSQDKKIEFKPETLNINEIFSNVIVEVSATALKKRIKVENKLDNKDLEIYFDRNIIMLILRNLLMNAIKFSNKESSIFINAVQIEAGKVVFSVKDFGVGMTPDYAATIFNDDMNIDVAAGTNGEKGVGLGLSLCKEFVTSHNGEIWVESTPGKGSTFFFTIKGEK
ncbi:two-component regulator propeller domain-containing protein [uncultured Draconibacterium sp.]|uniref:two-component regulator propeller domain-containing protein n=1 Tax=uncultured Draconibacterium sp. TaxID=1573823 RepID=UPI0029C8A0BF|nr:two-component regulator propeller domain-containing protein [uncultured Draconibacterium sp.]